MISFVIRAQVTVTCTFIEVYNNTVRDLLEGAASPALTGPLKQVRAQPGPGVLVRDPDPKGEVVLVSGAKLQLLSHMSYVAGRACAGPRF